MPGRGPPSDASIGRHTPPAHSSFDWLVAVQPLPSGFPVAGTSTQKPVSASQRRPAQSASVTQMGMQMKDVSF
jgi:hypothetical protein